MHNPRHPAAVLLSTHGAVAIVALAAVLAVVLGGAQEPGGHVYGPMALGVEYPVSWSTRCDIHYPIFDGRHWELFAQSGPSGEPGEEDDLRIGAKGGGRDDVQRGNLMLLWPGLAVLMGDFGENTWYVEMQRIEYFYWC